MAQWLEVSAATAPPRLPALTDWLTAAEVGGLVVEDEADFHRFLRENRGRWDYVDDALLERWRGACRVKFYLPDTEGGASSLRAVREGLSALGERLGWPADAVSLSAARLDSADWENGWKQYYRPMPVGERLYILPEWETEAAVPPGRTALRMNPGLLFGTGDHASTRLCLEAAERYVTPGARVLDLGCGSGILAIAALLLGAKSAAACDLDELAAQVAAENGARSGIPPERLTLHTGNILTDARLVRRLTAEPANLIFANIVADVIIPLSARVGAWLAPGGVFLCSGIIEARAAEVAAALSANGLAIRERNERDGWVCFVCAK